MKRGKPLALATSHIQTRQDVVQKGLVAKFSDGYHNVEAEDGHVIVKGGWWYRGEYLLETHGNGTRVTLTIYNNASRARWAVPLANKLFIGFFRATKQGLDGLLQEIEANGSTREQA
jgi:hypothetical protein